MTPPPTWAIDTLTKAWQGIDKPPPTLVWRRSRGSYHSSGHCNYEGTRIVVTAGTKAPRWEQKMVLLHELAHAIAPPEAHHNEEFWIIAWRLYRQFKLPVRRVRANEERYRKTARTGYLATRTVV